MPSLSSSLSAAALLAAGLALAVASCSDEPTPPPDIETLPEPPIHTPRWAFRPWISKDISTGADTRDFVDGFKARGIPVGVVVLDSPWETFYNSLIPHPVRYPEFGKLVSDLRAQDVRMVLWLTPLTNDVSYDLEPGGDTYEGPSPNYNPGKSAGYFVNDAAVYFWWKGTGSGVDFFNADARRWWHAQQKPLLDLGIAGWKLDFGESYIDTPTIKTAAGVVSHQEYSEEYYRDFYRYGANYLGTKEFVTMVRPYDKSYQFEGRFFARKEHAPVAWVGDNRRDWVGLEDALDHLFRSAAAGYVVIGSDVGGYLDRDDQDLLQMIPFDVETFARWTAVGALTPFMQLHGRANLTPWTVPERTAEFVALYRYWSVLHDELVPFWYGLAEEAYAGNAAPIMRPIGAEASWAGDYRYLLGDAFLVAPLLDARGFRAVALREGARWFDWWAPGAPALAGGTTVTASMSADIGRIPLYAREGAIVPATVSSTISGMGDARSAGHDSVLLYPGAGVSGRFVRHDEDEATTVITLDGLSASVSRAPLPLVLRVHADPPVARAELAGATLTEAASRAALGPDQYVREGGFLWVRLAARPAGVSGLRFVP